MQHGFAAAHAYHDPKNLKAQIEKLAPLVEGIHASEKAAGVGDHDFAADSNVVEADFVRRWWDRDND